MTDEVRHATSEEAAEAGRALVEEVAAHLCADVYPDDSAATLRSISRRLYKGTDCGAWISFEDGVSVGSIVEGVDEETDVQHLSMGEYLNMEEGQLGVWLDKAIEAVEADARRIWNETHGCEDCGPAESLLGYRHVNPDCKSCGGSGEVI